MISHVATISSSDTSRSALTYAVGSGRLASNSLQSLVSSALSLSQSLFNFDQDKIAAPCSR